MSPLHGVLRPLSEICHTINVIQVAPDPVCDPPHRLVKCMFGLKTALFHLGYQDQGQLSSKEIKIRQLSSYERFCPFLSYEIQ